MRTLAAAALVLAFTTGCGAGGADGPSRDPAKANPDPSTAATSPLIPGGFPMPLELVSRLRRGNEEFLDCVVRWQLPLAMSMALDEQTRAIGNSQLEALLIGGAPPGEGGAVGQILAEVHAAGLRLPPDVVTSSDGERKAVHDGAMVELTQVCAELYDPQLSPAGAAATAETETEVTESWEQACIRMGAPFLPTARRDPDRAVRDLAAEVGAAGDGAVGAMERLVAHGGPFTEDALRRRCASG